MPTGLWTHGERTTNSSSPVFLTGFDSWGFGASSQQALLESAAPRYDAMKRITYEDLMKTTEQLLKGGADVNALLSKRRGVTALMEERVKQLSRGPFLAPKESVSPLFHTMCWFPHQGG